MISLGGHAQDAFAPKERIVTRPFGMLLEDAFNLACLDLVHSFLKRDLLLGPRIMYLAVVARKFLELRILGVATQHGGDLRVPTFGGDGLEAVQKRICAVRRIVRSAFEEKIFGDLRVAFASGKMYR